MQVTDESVSYRKVTFTRKEILEKLGVDLDDFILASISFKDLTLTFTARKERA